MKKIADKIYSHYESKRPVPDEIIDKIQEMGLYNYSKMKMETTDTVSDRDLQLFQMGFHAAYIEAIMDVIFNDSAKAIREFIKENEGKN